MNPITLPIRELKPILTGLGKIIDKRIPVAGIDCVRIERTRTGQIELMASNLDTFAVARLEASVQGEPVAFLVPYEDLQNVTKSCGRDECMLLKPFGESVTIKFPVGGQMLEHRCQTVPVEQYPAIAEIRGGRIPIDAAFKEAFGAALSCASVDPTRPILNATFLDVSNPEGHYVVATDGKHLFSSNSIQLPFSESLIIPNHRFLGWKEFINDGNWTVRAGEVETGQPPRIEIESDHWRFSSLTLGGNYPNWRVVGPKAVRTTIDLGHDSITGLLRTIARIPDHDTDHAIGIEVNNGQCSLLTKTNSEQWTTVEMAEAKATGADVKVFLNRNLLMKALRFGLIRIEIHDPATPLRFSHASRQMVVMPLTAPDTLEPIQPPKSIETKRPMPQVETIEEAPKAEKPPLEAALTQIETIKTTYRDAIRGLNDLTDLLKQAAREQRTNEKEFHSIRQTLRSLQSVRF